MGAAVMINGCVAPTTCGVRGIISTSSNIYIYVQYCTSAISPYAAIHRPSSAIGGPHVAIVMAVAPPLDRWSICLCILIGSRRSNHSPEYLLGRIRFANSRERAACFSLFVILQWNKEARPSPLTKGPSPTSGRTVEKSPTSRPRILLVLL